MKSGLSVLVVVVVVALALALANTAVTADSTLVAESSRTIQELDLRNAEHRTKFRKLRDEFEREQLISFLQMNQDTLMDSQDEINALSTSTLDFYSKVQGKECDTMRSNMCKPCFKSNPAGKKHQDACEFWKKTCDHMFCKPLCTRLLWDVKLEATGGPDEFQSEANNADVIDAVQTQVVGKVCAEMMGCCATDDKAFINYMHDKAYKLTDQENSNVLSSFPHARIPIPYCQKNTQTGEDDPDKQCGDCTGWISLEIKEKEHACESFIDPMAAKDSNPAASAFERAKLQASQQGPAHNSFKLRCLELQKKVVPMAKGALADLKKSACGCLGCCAGSNCPFAPAYSSFDDALKAFKSDYRNSNEERKE